MAGKDDEAPEIPTTTGKKSKPTNDGGKKDRKGGLTGSGTPVEESRKHKPRPRGDRKKS